MTDEPLLVNGHAYTLDDMLAHFEGLHPPGRFVGVRGDHRACPVANLLADRGEPDISVGASQVRWNYVSPHWSFVDDANSDPPGWFRALVSRIDKHPGGVNKRALTVVKILRAIKEG